MAAQLKPLPASSFLGQGYRNLARAQAQTVLLNSLSTIFIEKKTEGQTKLKESLL